MENLVSIESLPALLSGQLFLQDLLDLQLKASIIVGLTSIVARLSRRVLSNSSSHLLWLNCLLCVALLPLAMIVQSLFPAVLVAAGPLTVITVQTSSAVSSGLAEQGWNSLFVICYSLVASLLLLRLLFSALALRHLNSSGSSCSDEAILKQLSVSRNALGISRNVIVKFSQDIASPMSFGLFKPVVILPTVAKSWAKSTLDDVIVHELSHIKRLDWPTMLFCHVLTSLMWINPFIWLAKNCVNESAEQACDATVLRCGSDGIGYAEDLLRLARKGLENKQAPILAQLMFDESNLTMRIQNILDGRLIGRASNVFVAGLGCSALMLLSACSGVNLFGSNPQNQEIQLLVEEPPQYPTRAANEGIEGWTLVGFTVNANGLVDEESVKVIDSEPAEIFNRTSIAAAKKFEFQPRIRNGRAVEIPGVQYVFRFVLEDEGAQSELREMPHENLEQGSAQTAQQRPPPLARSRRN